MRGGRECGQRQVHHIRRADARYALPHQEMARRILMSPITGALDDGRGRARVSLFRHKHEVESGRTSSVGMEVRLDECLK